MKKTLFALALISAFSTSTFAQNVDRLVEKTQTEELSTAQLHDLFVHMEHQDQGQSANVSYSSNEHDALIHMEHQS